MKAYTSSRPGRTDVGAHGGAWFALPVRLACLTMIMAFPGYSSAQFTESTAKLDTPVTGSLALEKFAGENNVLLLTGRSDDHGKQFALFRVGVDDRLVEAPLLKKNVPDRILFFDSGLLDGINTLFFVDAEGVSRLDPATGEIVSRRQAQNPSRARGRYGSGDEEEFENTVRVLVSAV